MKRRVNGTKVLKTISKLENKCDKRTVRLLPRMGKKAPLCYENLGQLIVYAELIGTCAYGCPGNTQEAHAVRYLVARASGFARAALRLARMGFYDEALIIVRSLGEVTNLFFLFHAAPESVEEWKKSDRAYRLDTFSPSKVRRRIESLGKTPAITAAKYAALCEVSTHPVPQLRPQAFNHAGRTTTGGIFFQKAGILVVLNELAEALSYLVALAAGVCAVPTKHLKEIREICLACLKSVGGVDLCCVDRVLGGKQGGAKP